MDQEPSMMANRLRPICVDSRSFAEKNDSHIIGTSALLY